MQLTELGGVIDVIRFMGGKGEFLLLGLDCLENEYRHLVSNPDRYILQSILRSANSGLPLIRKLKIS